MDKFQANSLMVPSGYSPAPDAIFSFRFLRAEKEKELQQNRSLSGFAAVLVVVVLGYCTFFSLNLSK
ncbi:MAG: hypothetical protein Ct9H300mP9_5210 [Candidatus Neomarinimicrobiota bacterium]|nr:MAG: hypothetical protein Ct9H300mP9_5210 [Candidatus Neomarinimicrobiota bacterium]